MAELSIVIPVLNDAQALQRLLQDLQPWRGRCQVIVVDGGSSDESASIAMRHADNWLVTEPGRARQMQAGADIATAPRLWFLHADSLVPESLVTVVLRLPADIKWGFSAVKMDDTRLTFRVVAAAMNARSRWTRIATGDQGIFVDRNVFIATGGFALIPLMEDIELSKRLRRISRPECLAGPIVTSARRWRDKGVWRTIFLMWWLRFQFFIGVSPDRLYRRYYVSA